MPGGCGGALARAAERDIPVVLLTVGGSAAGQAMVAAHSGALAAADGGWEALCRAHGVHRVSDLAELADTLELFAIGRRPGAGAGAGGTAGGGHRHRARLRPGTGARRRPGRRRWACRSRRSAPATTDRAGRPARPRAWCRRNPLDVWGTGADTRELFAGALTALAGDPAVAAVALAVDLVPELDGDRVLPAGPAGRGGPDRQAAGRAGQPAAADRPGRGRRLRAAGIPVLEGTRTGLLALRHLLDRAERATGRPSRPAAPVAPAVDAGRQRRGRDLLASGQASGAALLGLLAEYGIRVARTEPAADAAGALAAAASIGYPVVLKTDEPGVAHKSDAGGVLLGIADPAALAAGYADLAARLGPRVVVCQVVPAGVELALGVVTDPGLGPLVVVGAGGVLVEMLADRAVALPPVDAARPPGCWPGCGSAPCWPAPGAPRPPTWRR